MESSQGLDIGSLEDAISKLRTFGGKKEFDAKLQAQVASCNKYYLSMIHELNLANYPTSDQILTEAIPAKLAEDILKLDQFGYQNAQTLQAILTKHDAVAEFPLMHSYQWKMQRNDFCSSEALEPLLMRLSSQYVMLKKQEGREEKREPGGVSTTTFERKSIKFWIRPNDVVRVICDIVKKMPIHSHGKVNRFSQYTTSVYYDDLGLNMYAQRLAKEEDATLIRFRWYNDMTKDTNVFVERKVHHEKWVLESSNKMRFVLPQGNILGYVNGTYEGTPEIVKKHPMFTEVQQRILKQHLVPCLQTRYNRAAFQMDDDDSVRLSLDTNLMMLQESGVDITKAWRRQENTYLEHDVHQFPFAVLEVKLHNHLLDNPPLWVSQLMDGGMLIRVDKFSKYGHGVAVLYGDQVKTLPYWLDPKFSQNISQGGRGDSDRVNDELPDNLSTKDSSMNNTSNVRSRQPTRSFFDDAAAAAMPTARPVKPNPRKSGRCGGCCRRKKPAPKIETRLRIEPKTYFANERTFMQWFMTAIFIGGMGVNYIVSVIYERRILGEVLLGFSIALACYSLLVFHWRIHMLKIRQPSASYGDRCGPTGLSLVFIAIIIWGLTLMMPTIVPAPPAISTLCNSRLCYEMDRCTLPATFSTPPAQDFSATGMAGISQNLYISSTDGRIGVLDVNNHHVSVWDEFWLSTSAPSPFLGLASVGSSSSHLYGLRSSPMPEVIEIDVATRAIKRVFTFDYFVEAPPLGLAIAPAKNGSFVAYIPAEDGWVTVYDLPIQSTNQTVAHFSSKFLPGNKSPAFVNLPNTNVTRRPVLVAQYTHGQLVVMNEKYAYSYNLTDEGQPFSTNTAYQAFSFAVPQIRGAAFAEEHGYLVTQDDEGGREGARVLRVQYDHDKGFGFCA